MPSFEPERSTAGPLVTAVQRRPLRGRHLLCAATIQALFLHCAIPSSQGAEAASLGAEAVAGEALAGQDAKTKNKNVLYVFVYRGFRHTDSDDDKILVEAINGENDRQFTAQIVPFADALNPQAQPNFVPCLTKVNIRDRCSCLKATGQIKINPKEQDWVGTAIVTINSDTTNGVTTDFIAAFRIDWLDENTTYGCVTHSEQFSDQSRKLGNLQSLAKAIMNETNGLVQPGKGVKELVEARNQAIESYSEEIKSHSKTKLTNLLWSIGSVSAAAASAGLFYGYANSIPRLDCQLMSGQTLQSSGCLDAMNRVRLSTTEESQQKGWLVGASLALAGSALMGILPPLFTYIKRRK